MLVGSPTEGLSGGGLGGEDLEWSMPEAPTIASGVCLHPSLKFQEEMDNRMMTPDLKSTTSDLDRGSLSCGGCVCSCLPCLFSSCSPRCCGSDLMSAGSVSSLSPSDNAVCQFSVSNLSFAPFTHFGWCMA